MSITVSSGGSSSLGNTIETGEITNEAVTTAKIAAASVTLSKMGFQSINLLAEELGLTTETSITFSGLDSSEEIAYLLIWGGSTGAFTNANLWVNADETAANYDSQELSSYNGNNIVAAESNTSILVKGYDGQHSSGFALINTMYDGTNQKPGWNSTCFMQGTDGNVTQLLIGARGRTALGSDIISSLKVEVDSGNFGKMDFRLYALGNA